MTTLSNEKYLRIDVIIIYKRNTSFNVLLSDIDIVYGCRIRENVIKYVIIAMANLLQFTTIRKNLDNVLTNTNHYSSRRLNEVLCGMNTELLGFNISDK